MRLPDEQREKGLGTPVIYTIAAVSVFVLILLAVVLISNNPKKSHKGMQAKSTASPITEQEEPEKEMEFAKENKDIESLYREHKLRAEDLDFWGMYQNETVVIEPEPTGSPSPEPTHEPTREEMAADGKHVKVIRRDGEEEWVEISKKIPLYTYDFTNIKISGGKMAYYIDDEKCSWLGVDLSQKSGRVDFETLKNSGVDFVMLRLGGRGYESGLLSLDERFAENIAGAREAGLEVGVSFYSQAVNTAEAEEEAAFVVNNLISFDVRYPVAFVMEYVVNDEARIDSLSAAQKTKIADAFLAYVEKEGYQPILYGNTNWLLGELVPDKLLANYDVWLNEPSAVPDYPYQFRMWKYAGEQSIAGVENKAAYLISFIDYTRR